MSPESDVDLAEPEAATEPATEPATDPATDDGAGGGAGGGADGGADGVADGPADDSSDVRGGSDADADAERSWAWHLGRASGIALLVLLPTHLVSFHLQPDAPPMIFETLVARWDTPWRLLDWATLVLALLHGGLSLQARLEEAPDHGLVHTVVATAVIVAVGIAVTLLTVVVFTLGLF